MDISPYRRQPTMLAFLVNARAKHGNKFDYGRAIYVNSKTPVVIICPIHGEFSQRPDVHVKSLWGCKKCGTASMADQRRRSPDEFIGAARKVHGDTYDYADVEYVNDSTNVDIRCRIHGLFQQTPNNHLSGKGCMDCGHARTGDAQRHTQEDFIAKAVAVHGNTYTYENTQYVLDDIHVLITCPTHGDFSQTPSNHLRGQGCNQC